MQVRISVKWTKTSKNRQTRAREWKRSFKAEDGEDFINKDQIRAKLVKINLEESYIVTNGL